MLFQASMTSSALSLYLDETKTYEDSMFHSEISPIKKDGIYNEAENKSNLNMSAGARDASSTAKGDTSEIWSPTSLELQKVLENILYANFKST